jgi:8-oxo-dGTP diphosphatase
MRKVLSAKDKEFLRTYDPGRYPHPSVAVDLCIFSIREGALVVHLVERDEPPYEGSMALPGGFVRMDESLEDAARRILREKGGLDDVFLEQLYTFGDLDRDPRTRVVSVAYYALLGGQVDAGKGELRPFPATDAPPLAFDHDRILETALARVRGKLEWTTIAFQLMPREFTLTELQRVYEVILGKPLAKPAFRRRILDAGVVRPTKNMRRGGHRPARLYRFIEGRRS